MFGFVVIIMYLCKFVGDLCYARGMSGGFLCINIYFSKLSGYCLGTVCIIYIYHLFFFFF